MAKPPRKSNLDYSPYTGAVVWCPNCDWRHHTPDIGRGWYQLARHLKNAHGDLHATKKARANAWAAGFRH